MSVLLVPKPGCIGHMSENQILCRQAALLKQRAYIRPSSARQPIKVGISPKKTKSFPLHTHLTPHTLSLTPAGCTTHAPWEPVTMVTAGNSSAKALATHHLRVPQFYRFPSFSRSPFSHFSLSFSAVCLLKPPPPRPPPLFQLSLTPHHHSVSLRCFTVV